MSSVTSVILVTPLTESRGRRPPNHPCNLINGVIGRAYRDGHTVGQLAQVDPLPGPKGMEGDLWACGFNYLCTQLFLDALVDAPWYHPREVRLLIHVESLNHEGYKTATVQELRDVPAWQDLLWGYGKPTAIEDPEPPPWKGSAGRVKEGKPFSVSLPPPS